MSFSNIVSSTLPSSPELVSPPATQDIHTIFPTKKSNIEARTYTSYPPEFIKSFNDTLKENDNIAEACKLDRFKHINYRNISRYIHRNPDHFPAHKINKKISVFDPEFIKSFNDALREDDNIANACKLNRFKHIKYENIKKYMQSHPDLFPAHKSDKRSTLAPKKIKVAHKQKTIYTPEFIESFNEELKTHSSVMSVCMLPKFSHVNHETVRKFIQRHPDLFPARDKRDKVQFNTDEIELIDGDLKRFEKQQVAEPDSRINDLSKPA